MWALAVLSLLIASANALQCVDGAKIQQSGVQKDSITFQVPNGATAIHNLNIQIIGDYNSDETIRFSLGGFCGESVSGYLSATSCTGGTFLVMGGNIGGSTSSACQTWFTAYDKTGTQVQDDFSSLTGSGMPDTITIYFQAHTNVISCSGGLPDSYVRAIMTFEGTSGDCGGYSVGNEYSAAPGSAVATAPPTPASTPAPTAAPSVTALGDAHFFGPHGDRTDFKGRNNTYYNVLSTNNLSVAVLFMHDTYNWRNKVVFGSWMKAIAASAMTAENKLVKAAYHCERPSVMDVHFEGEAEPNGQVALGADFTFQQVMVSLSKNFVFTLSNGEWEVTAKNNYLPYMSQNVQKKRLDVNLKTISNVDLNPVAPHGLIGQAWDRDDKMVIGALDDYAKEGRVVETSANAEGAIEGSAIDYEIDPLDPFGTKFKYSRFGLKRAAPRDVSSLSGKKFAVKKTASAGAINDEDNESV